MIFEPMTYAVLSVLAGAAAAQLAGPVSLGWPARTGELVARIAALALRRPSRQAKAIGATIIGAILVGGGLTAYAAMPATPKRMIARAVQVAGLSVRDAFLGDRVAPTAIPGERAMAAPAPAADPTRADDDVQLLKAAIETNLWDGATPMPGLTFAETERDVILAHKVNLGMAAAAADIRARAARAGLPPVSLYPTPESTLAILGPDAMEYALLEQKREDERQRQAAEAYDKYGPVEFHFSGPGPEVAARKALYPGAGWINANRRDGSGLDIIMTPRPDPLFPLPLEVAANPPPLALRVESRIPVPGREGRFDLAPVIVPTWNELDLQE